MNESFVDTVVSWIQSVQAFTDATTKALRRQQDRITRLESDVTDLERLVTSLERRIPPTDARGFPSPLRHR